MSSFLLDFLMFERIIFFLFLMFNIKDVSPLPSKLKELRLNWYVIDLMAPSMLQTVFLIKKKVQVYASQ